MSITNFFRNVQSKSYKTRIFGQFCRENEVIHSERTKDLNSRSEKAGEYVVYWMQQSARAHYNHALELALQQAATLGLPLLVVFVLTDTFPEANLRHYRFLLEGLEDTRARLADRGIQFTLLRGEPVAAVSAVAARAALLVCDRGYLRIQRQWRAALADSAPCRVTEVESDVVIPVRSAYPKEAYNAATLRRHINPQLDTFLRTPQTVEPEHQLSAPPSGEDLAALPALLGALAVDRSVQPVTTFRGGTREANRRLDDFVADALHRYDEERSDPSLNAVSHLSPYLHFGHISPIRIALAVRDADTSQHEKDAFLEELIVRRELAMNFCFYNPGYDSCDTALPDWARQSLAEHQPDSRPALYDHDTLEAAQTDDPYWNAAQTEMLETGKMHNYMRMYWGKKLIEWSTTPQQAFEIALELNNKYELDGRDPNSFSGVAWCFGKHDRPWQERPVFGKIRYMNANGLRRKFDIESYVKNCNKRN